MNASARNDPRPLRLGVIGMSDANGHPYSWSAIFNGYDTEAMARCPFQVIPAYLAERRFPEDSLEHLGRVTHVYTQDVEVSRSIAAASRIPNIVERPEDLIGAVDAVLLARDDAENHRKFASPFLAAGLPIYIDKPFALSQRDAEELWSLERHEGQIFTCSALRYSPELEIGPEERARIGRVRFIDATVPKKWQTYAVHLLEPIIASFAADWGIPLRVRQRDVAVAGEMRRLTFVLEDDIIVSVTTTGAVSAPLGFRLHGERGMQEHVFRDSFVAFRAALEAFVTGIRTGERPIPRSETQQIVACLEWGMQTTSDRS